MDGKIFSKEAKAFLVRVIGDLIKVPAVFKPIKGLIISWVLSLLEKYGDKVIPDNFDPAINSVAILVANGQYEEAGAVAGELLDTIVNVKIVPDELEKALFVDGTRLLVRAVVTWIKNKKG